MEGGMEEKKNNLFLANPPDEDYHYFNSGDQEEHRAKWPLVVEQQMIQIVRSINIGGEEDGR
jgi:hypothetical protein